MTEQGPLWKVINRLNILKTKRNNQCVHFILISAEMLKAKDEMLQESSL